jgi:hypothetical protein
VPKRVGPKQILGANSFSSWKISRAGKNLTREGAIASTLEPEFLLSGFLAVGSKQIVGNEPVTRK